MAFSASNPQGIHRQERRHTCFGVTEELKVVVSEKRRSDKPQPWVARKYIILVTLGVIGYVGYAYIGRLCVPMIRKDSNATGNRGTGIVLLSVFSTLYLWLIWAYVKVVVTSPGIAAELVEKQLPPVPAQFPTPGFHQTHDTVEMGSSTTRVVDQQYPTFSYNHSHQHPDGIGGPSYEDIALRQGVEEAAIGPMDGLTIPRDRTSVEGQYVRSPKGSTSTAPIEPPTFDLSLSATSHNLKKTGKPQKQRPYISRRPPTFPNLIPENRYCVVDEIIKPGRTHHCRICGTCILKYDHHCPWQCVGARNHKFFVNFLEATCIIGLYSFSTLLGFALHGHISLEVEVDPQHFVGAGIAAFFALFSTMLLVSHIRLIWMNQSTVEGVGMRHRKEQEERSLSRAYSWWEFTEKHRKVREWNQEWGHPNTEGNPWWQDSGRQAWEEVMGRSILGWFLPIGRSLNDGLRYPINPRFDEQGRLRRRVEWPEHLR